MERDSHEKRCRQDNACRFDESGHPSQPGGRTCGEPVLRRTLVAESKRFSSSFGHGWPAGKVGKKEIQSARELATKVE